MNKIVLFIIGFGLCFSSIRAQNSNSDSAWSIGTSLTYPIARIYQININYKLDDKHEVFFGPAFQNFRSDNLVSNAYTLNLGYRYYVWNNLNVEMEFWPAYNRMYSKITERHYPGIEAWGELKVGYKLDIYQNLYLHPAPGIGFGIFRTNRPPMFDEDIISPIFVPQLILGIRL